MSRRGENIRKRKDGRWEGRYIKGYDSKKQKARYASVYGKTYAETKQKLDEAKYKSSIGVVYVDAKNKLFGEIINSWFNAKKINLKPSSIIKYQNLIEKHILPELGHRKLRELNADLFYTFLDAQQKNGNKKNGGMLSTSSLQTMLYILNATIKYAASNNMVAYFSICLTRSGKEATPIQTLEQLWGKHFAKSKVFNVFSDEESKQYATIRLGEIFATKPNEIQSNTLIGWWDAEKLLFQFNGEEYAFQKYNLFQNIFSRNTGILESDMLHNKCAFILGCGSVGSLVALELARTGIGKFVLVDNDILEYHNLCRHQCSISEVGEYKVDALKRRILEINPSAEVEPIVSTVEMLDRPVFDTFCLKEQTVLIGCADNRSADVYANSISVMYGIPFLSIGFWERAFAGEIFYYLPRKNMPCYKCALGDGNLMSQRTSTNRRLYTNEEDLSKVNFEPGISVDINFVTTIGIKLLLDIFNLDNDEYTPRLLSTLTQYTLVCNTNNPKIGGEMAEIFSYPLQVTTSLQVGHCASCPPCEFE